MLQCFILQLVLSSFDQLHDIKSVHVKNVLIDGRWGEKGVATNVSACLFDPSPHPPVQRTSIDKNILNVNRLYLSINQNKVKNTGTIILPKKSRNIVIFGFQNLTWTTYFLEFQRKTSGWICGKINCTDCTGRHCYVTWRRIATNSLHIIRMAVC